jgi:hypothetical protein
MSNPTHQFRAGENQTFIATRSFALGSSGITVPEGSEVVFDGTSVSYAGLAPVVMPQLRGALRAGWIVPKQQYDPNAPAQRPQAAGMTVRQADGGNPMKPDNRRQVVTTVDEEEREVGNVGDHAAATRARNKENYRRKRTPRQESTAGQRYEGGAVEAQDGVEVPGVSFQTPAGEESKKTSTDMTRAGSAISRANKVKIVPGKGRTREELIRDAIQRGGLTGEELQEYQEELAAAISARGGDASVVNQIVGHVPAPGTRETEGFVVAGSVGGGTAIEDLGGTGAQGRQQVVEEEGIKFTQTAGPKRDVRLVDTPAAAPPAAEASPVDDAVCRTIAKAVCADFPENYVFTDPIRKKIARLQADYDDRPDVIKAVAAAETDGEVKRRLVQEFPEAFG